MKPNAVKRIGLVKHRKDLSYEEFTNHWLNVHAELCKKLPNMRRYSVNLISREQSEAFGYDGFSELWFDSADALAASLASPALGGFPPALADMAVQGVELNTYGQVSFSEFVRLMATVEAMKRVVGK